MKKQRINTRWRNRSADFVGLLNRTHVAFASRHLKLLEDGVVNPELLKPGSWLHQPDEASITLSLARQATGY